MKKIKGIKGMILVLALFMMVVLGCAGCAQVSSADNISKETTIESDNLNPEDIEHEHRVGPSVGSQTPHEQDEITLPEVVITQQ